MNSERWKQVEGVLQLVLDRAPEERDGFLGQACAGDETLEREVRSLLTSEDQAGSFRENPALEVAARELARRQIGDAFAVQHFHGRLSYHQGGWSAAAGRIALVLVEGKGNIWMMSRPSSR
jgi:hypothetical protein